MTTEQQGLQTEQILTRGKQRRRLPPRMLVVIIVLLLAVAIIIIWILSYLRIFPNIWASIFTIIITVLGAVFAFFQSMHLFIPAERSMPSESHPQTSSNLPNALSPQIQSNIVQLYTTPSPSMQPLPLDKTAHRGIVGLLPPTDPRTIQQREHIVKEVYKRLTQPDITAIALTGLGGIGKSTLAALIYHYTEEQRLAPNCLFQAETLWFTADPAVTFADLAGNLFDALGKPLPDLSNLAPQNQAIALFNALNTTETPRLIIYDQFENLLDWNTGHALADRPGVGEWLDMLNSQQFTCRILLTSRPRPVGTREYPPTYLQEYPVGGLKPDEGVALPRNQGVQGLDEELQSAVSFCTGHAFSLTLLALLLRDHHLSLATLFKHTSLWSGDIATNLLDQIYQERLNDIQRELLIAFSVYREPVPFEAALAIIPTAEKGQLLPSLKALRTQHLLEAVGEGSYQLHAIIEAYARTHFDESSVQANEEALRAARARAAQYYLPKFRPN